MAEMKFALCAMPSATCGSKCLFVKITNKKLFLLNESYHLFFKKKRKDVESH
jgi:hypothetical protein